MLTILSGYLGDAIRNPKKIASLAKEILKNVDFDTLVGTGLSGGLILPVLSQELEKSFVVVRKPREDSHSINEMEGILGHRWLFVDDLIDTGKTFKRTRKLIKGIANQFNHPTEFKGAFFYKSLIMYADILGLNGWSSSEFVGYKTANEMDSTFPIHDEDN